MLRHLLVREQRLRIARHHDAATVENVTAVADVEALAGALFDDERFASIVVGLIQTDPVTSAIKMPPVLRAVRELRPGKPVICAGLDDGAAVPPEYIEEMRSLGIPYFPSTERALRAVTRLAERAARVDRPAWLDR